MRQTDSKQAFCRRRPVGDYFVANMRITEQIKSMSLISPCLNGHSKPRLVESRMDDLRVSQPSRGPPRSAKIIGARRVAPLLRWLMAGIDLGQGIPASGPA